MQIVRSGWLLVSAAALVVAMEGACSAAPPVMSADAVVAGVRAQSLFSRSADEAAPDDSVTAAEANRKAEEARRQAAEAEARKRAEEDARRRAEAEEQRRHQAETETRKRTEDESRRQAAEARRRAEEDARRAALEAESRRKAEEDAKRLAAEAEAARRSAEEHQAAAACAAALADVAPRSVVLFGLDETKLPPESLSILDRIVRALALCSRLSVTVEGHTDTIGPATYNQALSEKRAAAVADYLIKAGIDAARVKVRGYGMTRPVAPSGSVGSHARNRRIELHVRPQ